MLFLLFSREAKVLSTKRKYRIRSKSRGQPTWHFFAYSEAECDTSKKIWQQKSGCRGQRQKIDHWLIATGEVTKNKLIWILLLSTQSSIRLFYFSSSGSNFSTARFVALIISSCNSLEKFQFGQVLGRLTRLFCDVAVCFLWAFRSLAATRWWNEMFEKY